MHRDLSKDELRALLFIALLLALASAARFLARPEPVLPGELGLDVAALEAGSRAALEEERERSRPLEPGERLDPNRATAPSLDRLPGVGEAMADRIVAERERAGAFRSPADLRRVAGIGEKTAARLAPHLDFDAPPPAELRRITAARSAVAGNVTRPPRERGPAPSGVGRRSSVIGPASAASPLALNRASAADLESLPGIGPVLAARILAYRDSAGPFSSVDELTRVKGVGDATLERLRPLVRVP